MSKENAKPKFRWLRVAVSNEIYAGIEATAKRNEITRSKVVSECCDILKNAPLSFLNLRTENILRRQAEAIRTAPDGMDTLDFRRGPDREKSAMLMSLDAKLDAWRYEKAAYEKLRDTLADMPDDEVDIYVREQNLARLKGLDANIEMAECLRQEEIENGD